MHTPMENIKEKMAQCRGFMHRHGRSEFADYCLEAEIEIGTLKKTIAAYQTQEDLLYYRDCMHLKYKGPFGYPMNKDESHTWRSMSDDECSEYRHRERLRNEAYKTIGWAQPFY